MKLDIKNLQKLYLVDKKQVRTIVQKTLKEENKDADLTVVFLDNKKIHELNKKFLNHDYATDVISFDYSESGDQQPAEKNKITGEICISVEMALQVAEKYGYDTKGEIALYLIHGLLHMLGYDDKNKRNAKRMHRREGEILTKLGYNIRVPD